MKKDLHFETLQVHAGYTPDKTNSRVAPIYPTTAFVFDSAEHGADLFNLDFKEGHAPYIYSRLNNPTVSIFEQRMAALEGGVAAVAVSSGQSAEFITMLSLLQAGDNAVVSPYLYGGTYNQFFVSFQRLGIEMRKAASDKAEDLEKLIDEKTKAIYVENIVCQPIKLGADIVVESATKWIGGHGTVMGGIIIDGGSYNWKNGKFPLFSEPSEGYHGLVFAEKFGKSAFAMRCVAESLRDFGPCLSPFNAWQMLQGLETLSIRVQKMCDNAMLLAEWLRTLPEIKSVSYLGLPDHPYHDLATKYLHNGYGAVLTFRMKGGLEETVHFVEGLELISHLTNIGDVRTLITHPASTTHRQMSEEAQKAAGVYPDMLRLSVGLEHLDDIKDDILQALRK